MASTSASPPTRPSTASSTSTTSSDIETLDLSSLSLHFPTHNPYFASSTPSLSTSLEPIVLSTSLTTAYSRELHELLQSPQLAEYRLFPEFDYTSTTTSGGVSGFTGTLKLSCRTTEQVVKEITTAGCYPNKKRAKEEVAKEAVEWLRTSPKEIEACPKKVVDVAAGIAAEGLDERENWVGELAAFCQQRNAQPVYTMYQSPSYLDRFSADVKGIPGVDEMVFGEKTAYYKNRKTAKIQAAKAAVLWIRANPPALPAGPAVQGTGKRRKKKLAVAAPGETITVPARAGPVEKVSLVLPRMGFEVPQYKIEQDPRAPSIYDIGAHIPRLNGEKGIKIDPLRGIRGKKNAKEVLAKAILKWIKKEAEKKQIIIQEEIVQEEIVQEEIVQEDVPGAL